MEDSALKQILIRSRNKNLLYPELAENRLKLALKTKEIRSKLSTHAVVSDFYHISLLKGIDHNLHISVNRYLPTTMASIFNKNLSQDIIEPLEKMCVHLMYLIFDTKGTEI